MCLRTVQVLPARARVGCPVPGAGSGSPVRARGGGPALEQAVHGQERHPRRYPSAQAASEKGNPLRYRDPVLSGLRSCR